MVAYFKKQNNLFMFLGVVIALLLSYPYLSAHFNALSPWTAGFIIIVVVIAGIIAGRIFSSVWSNRQLRRIDGLLYQQNDPRAFIAKFEPLVKKAPDITAEYVNGYVKIAYAYEALGEFEKGLAVLANCHPENLKLHALQTAALCTNQNMKLRLLMEDSEGSAAYLEDLKTLQKASESRIPALAANLKECIHLGEIWIGINQGGAGEQKYLEEEISLAKNEIHKNEMKLLSARGYLNSGEEEKARELLKETAAGKKELFSTRKAEELLKLYF